MGNKYNKLLAPDMLEFIRQSEEFYPSDAIDMTIVEQREFYSRLSAAFAGERPENVSTSVEFYRGREGSVPVRHYENLRREPSGHVAFFHGGGFILGGFDSHDSICADICDRSNCDVTAVDYRLAPEHLHPSAFDDCLTALRRVTLDKGRPMILVGDSAGGNLAAAVSKATRNEKCKPKGQVLIYPALGGEMSSGSYVEHANAPLLSTSDMEYYENLRAGGQDLTNDVSAMPLSDRDLSDLPQTVVFSAQCDPLCDDGRAYCANITAAGGKAEFVEEQGLVHGYLRARSSVKKAAKSFNRIVKAIDMLVDRA